MMTIDSVIHAMEDEWRDYLLEMLKDNQSYYKGDKIIRASSTGSECTKKISLSREKSFGGEPPESLLRKFAIGYIFEKHFKEACENISLKGSSINFEVSGETDMLGGTLEIVIELNGKRIGVDLKTTTETNPPSNVGERLQRKHAYIRGY